MLFESLDQAYVIFPMFLLQGSSLLEIISVNYQVDLYYPIGQRTIEDFIKYYTYLDVFEFEQVNNEIIFNGFKEPNMKYEEKHISNFKLSFIGSEFKVKIN